MLGSECFFCGKRISTSQCFISLQESKQTATETKIKRAISDFFFYKMKAASSSTHFFGIREEEQEYRYHQQQLPPLPQQVAATSGSSASAATSQTAVPPKKKRNLPGNPSKYLNQLFVNDFFPSLLRRTLNLNPTTDYNQLGEGSSLVERMDYFFFFLTFFLNKNIYGERNEKICTHELNLYPN